MDRNENKPTDFPGPLETNAAGIRDERDSWHPILTAALLLCALSVLVPRRFSQIGSVDLLTPAYAGLVVFLFAVIHMRRIPSARSHLGPAFSSTITILLVGTSYFRFLMGLTPDLSEVWRSAFLGIVAVGTHLLSTLRLNRPVSEKYLRLLVIVVTASMGLSILWAFYVDAFQTRLGALRVLSGGADTARATSPFGGPNLVGTLGATILPLCMLFQGKRRIVISAVLLLGTILAGSKTGFVSLVCGIGLTVVAYLPHKPGRSVLLVLATAAAAILAFQYGSRLSALLNPWSALQLGGSARMDTWKEALRLIWQRPVVGWGKDFLYFGGSFGRTFAAHNVWLQLLLDYGLFLGLAFAVSLAVSLGRLAFLGFSRGRAGAAVGASTVAFLVSTLGDYIFWEPRALVFMGVLFGSYVVLIRSMPIREARCHGKEGVS